MCVERLLGAKSAYYLGATLICHENVCFVEAKRVKKTCEDIERETRFFANVGVSRHVSSYGDCLSMFGAISVSFWLHFGLILAAFGFIVGVFRCFQTRVFIWGLPVRVWCHLGSILA